MFKNILQVLGKIALLFCIVLVIKLINTGLKTIYPIQYMYDWVRMTIGLSLEMVFGVAVIAILSKGKYSDWGFRKCKFNVCLKAFGWALILSLIECVIVITLVFFLFHIGSFSYTYRYTPEEYPSFAYFVILITVIAPPAEEILFRGFF